MACTAEHQFRNGCTDTRNTYTNTLGKGLEDFRLVLDVVEYRQIGLVEHLESGLGC